MLGLGAGLASGILGIGGGAVVIPALVIIFGFSQHQAQGTTLAMLIPPIGLLAAWVYYSKGHVDVRVAALLCAGFFLGGFVGARIANMIPALILRRIFGVFLIIISIKLIFQK